MKLVTFLYPGMTTLDLVGPHEVLARLPDAEAVSYTHLTLPTMLAQCRSRWSPYH